MSLTIGRPRSRVATGLVAPALGKPRLDSLDGLRGGGALAVIIAHYVYRAPELYPELGIQYDWASPVKYLINLFFLVSGFLIFMTLRRGTVRRFATARIIRLYPVYWLCVALTFAIVSLVQLPGRQVTLGEALINLTMTQSFFGVPHVDGAYWTLAVELVFYVQCGLLLAAGLTGQRALGVVLPVWLGLSALTLVPGLHPHGAVVSGIWDATRWTPFFIIGVVLYLRWDGERRPSRLMYVPLSIAVITVGSPTEGAIAAALTVAMCIAVWGPDVGLSSPLLAWLGTISYPLYLLHQNIGYVVLRGLAPWVQQRFAVPIAVAALLALATVVTYRFDIPVRAALTRRFLRRS